MVEAAWDIDRHQWSLMSRCNKCGWQIYPHSSKMAYQWAEMAFEKASSGGPSPEALRDERYPNLKQHLRQKTRVLYY